MQKKPISLTKRAGFGILRSMAGGSSQRKAKYKYDGCSTTYVGNDVMFEQVGKTYMDYLEVDKEIAQRYIDRALQRLSYISITIQQDKANL